MTEMLDEIIENPAVESEDEELQCAVILDDPSAEMFIRKINEANEQYESLEAWYKHQLEKAKQIRDRTVEWATRSLRGYFNMLPPEVKTGKKIKSYELKGAVLTLRKMEPKYTVDDEVMVPWLEKNKPDMVQVTKKAKWGELKKTLPKDKDGNFLTVQNHGCLELVDENGEIIPGVVAEPRDDEFTVKIK